MSRNSNSKRILNGLVSLEAWYQKSDLDNGEAPLTVDLVFNEAFFGDQKTDKLQFKVKLNKAQLTVISDRDGNLKIPRKSVRRDAPNMIGSTSVGEQKSKSVSAGASGEIQIHGMKAKAMAKVNSAAELARSDDSDTQMKFDHGAIIPEHFTNDEGHHCWRFNSAVSKQLHGKAFGTAVEVLNLVKASEAQIESSVKVMVECRREDLHIYDIKHKEEAKGLFRKAAKRTDNLRLAEEIIKDGLMVEGLGEVEMKNNHAVVVIADVLADVE